MKRLLLLAALGIVLLTACRPQTDTAFEHRPALYHWKTTFNPSPAEWKFLADHHVQRLYLRLFDVDQSNDKTDDGEEVVPVATTRFTQQPPREVELVPTVYITWGAMSRMGHDIDGYATKIVTRVLAMMQAHDLTQAVREVQLDCDWSDLIQEEYFSLCRAVRRQLQRHNILLSVTIRLHQLAQEAPPVERGVLMLYNTGGVTDSNTDNSILSYQHIRPYLKKRRYPIPLDLAYSTFGWGVLFNAKGEFRSLLHHSDYSDTTLYRPTQRPNVYEVKAWHMLDNHSLEPGDRIRYEGSPLEEILRVKGAVEPLHRSAASAVILYHWDEENLAKFSHHEIETIYR